MQEKSTAVGYARVNALAVEMGYHPSGFVRTLRRAGISVRKAGGNDNDPWVISPEEAQRFREHVRGKPLASVKDTAESKGRQGVYLVRYLDRMKIGWTRDLSQRVQAHRTAVPDLHLVAFWPTDQPWAESAALRAMGRQFEHIGGEVFRGCAEEAAAILESLFTSLHIEREV